MKKYILLSLYLILSQNYSFAQFHTLTIPAPSNRVIETQRLAITDITIDYSSPSVRGRDVWNNPNIIPQNGNPIAWRAGANMNTTIQFTSDVLIEGKALKKGKYGFHIIPKSNSFTLLFASNPNQWGSYYLDVENGIELSVDVSSVETSFSEKLDYEFINWTDSSVVIALEWADKRIPFTVSVDLDKTVIESFRSELLGINTYRWEAWNDAARWCLDRNTNLEEALEWTNRSIEGGYGGFASNRNPINVRTKILLLHRLDETEELTETIQNATNLYFENPNNTSQFTFTLIQLSYYEEALSILDNTIERFPNYWPLTLYKGLATHLNGDTDSGLTILSKLENSIPDNFKNRLNEIKKEVKNGTYSPPPLQ